MKKLNLVILAGIVSMALVGCSDTEKKEDKKDTNTSQTNTETNNPTENGNETNTNDKYEVWQDGVYEIGKDIPSGEYVIISYLENPKDDRDSGTITIRSTKEETDDTEMFYSSTALGVNTQNEYLKLYDGQFLVTTRAKIYKADSHPDLDKSKNGRFKVGVDIDAGTYTLTSDGNGTYRILSMIPGEYNNYDRLNVSDAIVQEETDFSGEKEITLTDGQYVWLENCSIK